MIFDLSQASTSPSLTADVLVVGAGIAGLLLATRLAAKGLRTVVLESGGLIQSTDTHPLNEVVVQGAPYSGAEHGRFRCLGGTSSRWGGAMLPFLPADMDPRSGSIQGWPITHGDLIRYLPEVESLFDLAAGPYERPQLVQMRDGRPADFIPRLAKWPAFRKRNVATLLEHDLKSEAGPEVWLNATATGFRFGPDGRLEGINASAPGGRQLEVAARHFVLAAGAIESTRLLLLADLQQDRRLFTPDDVLGRYFYDHLSIEVAAIRPLDRRRFNRFAGFQFDRKGMRNLRFEPAERRDVRAGICPCFAHIGFSTAEPTGFDALRDAYRAVQRRDTLGVRQIRDLIAAAPWLVRAGWWRFYERRLLYPEKADIQVHMVIEQAPCASNRIGLSPDRRDSFGQPLATIDWRVTGADRAALRGATDRFVSMWRESSLADLGTIVERPLDATLQAFDQSGGVYHPGGSTRMGSSPRDGVVDGDLRTFRVPNLRVVSTGVFPFGGGVNPTMMLMMAALRSAENIARTLRGAG